MSFRSTEIHVQPRTCARLRLTLKLYPQRGKADIQSGETWGMTIDALADRLLNQVVKEKYPDVIKLEKEIEELEEKACERCQNDIKQ